MWHPDSLPMALLGSFLFGLIGLALALLGYKMFDWITPKIHVEQELAEKQNIAVAIVVAAIIFSVAYVVATAIS